jgi:hypothetical protein
MTSEIPVSIPSAKSETEKPEYSKCVNRPMRIPRDIDSIPTANMFSSLSNKPVHQANDGVYSL